ncbi:MAG: hypothetical protein AB7I27_10965 [Bacteriovoracaceae bacterium]
MFKTLQEFYIYIAFISLFGWMLTYLSNPIGRLVRFEFLCLSFFLSSIFGLLIYHNVPQAFYGNLAMSLGLGVISAFSFKELFRTVI